MVSRRVHDRPPEHSATTRECTACGLFVYWQRVDGLDSAIDMNPASRAQVVAALLNERGVQPVYRAVPLGFSSVSMVAENYVLLARYLAAGGSLADWPTLHLGHPCRTGSARPVGRSAGPRHAARGRMGAEGVEPPPF